MEGGAHPATLSAGLRERAKWLFHLGDAEGKGFIVRRDMQRMASEVPLPPDQLEAVFDSLDKDGNGFLTLQHFLQGFGRFLGGSGRTQTVSTCSDDPGPGPGPGAGAGLSARAAALPHIRTGPLQQLCDTVAREGHDHLQGELEAAVRQLEEDLGRAVDEQRALQRAMRARDEDHDERVRKLCEEVQTHLAEETSVLAAQFESRSTQLRLSMEEELSAREAQLQEVTAQRDEARDRLRQMSAKLAQEQHEADTLRRDKEELTGCCAQQSLELQQLRETPRPGSRTRARSSAGEDLHLAAAGYTMARAVHSQERGLLAQLAILRELADTLERSRTQQERRDV